MGKQKRMPEGISIKESEITLVFYVEEAAMLAKACSIAANNTQMPENEKDAIAFRALAGMFKSATVAAIAQGYMDTEQRKRGDKSIKELLEMTQGEYGRF